MLARSVTLTSVLQKLRAGNFTSPIFLGFCASFLALAVSYARGIESLGIADAADYVRQAKDMLKGLSFMQANPNLFQHGLGFSFAIALTFLLTNSTSLILFKVALAAGYGLSTYLVARIGIEIGLKKQYWIAGAILFALDPFLLLTATTPQTESITTLIVLYWAFLYLVSTGEHRPTRFTLVAFPLTGFYATFMRPNFILPFLFVAFLMYFRWFREGTKALLLTLSSLVFIGLLSLYEVFISFLYSGFVFLSPIGGGNAEFMCRTEFIPQYLGFASASENTRINNWTLSHGAESLSSVMAQHPNLSTSGINHELYNLGISTCLSHPFQSVEVLFLKAFALWRPFAVYGAYSPKVFFATLALWLPLTIVALWFVFSRKLNKQTVKLKYYFLALSVSFTISLLLTPTQIRHRIAFAEPFYWLFAMILLARILNSRRPILRRFISRFRKDKRQAPAR